MQQWEIMHINGHTVTSTATRHAIDGNMSLATTSKHLSRVMYQAWPRWCGIDAPGSDGLSSRRGRWRQAHKQFEIFFSGYLTSSASRSLNGELAGCRLMFGKCPTRRIGSTVDEICRPTEIRRVPFVIFP